MGGTQGGCWKGLRAAAPGLPARQGEAITAASKVGSSIGPWPDRGSSLLRAVKAASGCEWPRIIEDFWACPGLRSEWGWDAAPADSLWHPPLRHWGRAMRTGGAARGPGSLTGRMGRCNSVLGAAASHRARMPPPVVRYGRGTRVIFLVG